MAAAARTAARVAGVGRSGRTRWGGMIGMGGMGMVLVHGFVLIDA